MPRSTAISSLSSPTRTEAQQADPEMYTLAINRLGLSPAECLIVEDNENGIRAARASGAHVMVVKGVDEVTDAAISERIATMRPGDRGMMRVLILGAGASPATAAPDVAEPPIWLAESEGELLVQRLVRACEGLDAQLVFAVRAADASRHTSTA